VLSFCLKLLGDFEVISVVRVDVAGHNLLFVAYFVAYT
jgi:hypothetical protein